MERGSVLVRQTVTTLFSDKRLLVPGWCRGNSRPPCLARQMAVHRTLPDVPHLQTKLDGDRWPSWSVNKCWSPGQRTPVWGLKADRLTKGCRNAVLQTMPGVTSMCGMGVMRALVYSVCASHSGMKKLAVHRGWVQQLVIIRYSKCFMRGSHVFAPFHYLAKNILYFVEERAYPSAYFRPEEGKKTK